MRIPTLVSAGLGLLGPTAMAQTISYAYDTAADFTRFKTYAWVRGTPVNDELNPQTRPERRRQLAAKGFGKVEVAAKAAEKLFKNYPPKD